MIRKGKYNEKNSERQTNNSYYTTCGLKNYSQKDVWSEQVADGKSVYAVWDYNIVMQGTVEAAVSVRCG